MKNKSLTTTSIVTAALASFCCIGPLAAAGLGLGAFGAAAVFESLRPYLLVVTGVLLATAFYLTYRKGSSGHCPGGTCAVSPANKRQRALLRIVTAVVVPLAAFPYYSSLFWGNAGSAGATALASTSTQSGQVQVVFDVEGMTCAGCAAGIQATLERKAGVIAAEVDFESKTARLRYDPSQVSVERLTAAITDLGYKATPRRMVEQR